MIARLKRRWHRLVTARARRTADLSADDWLDQLGKPRPVKRNLDDEAIALAHAPRPAQLGAFTAPPVR